MTEDIIDIFKKILEDIKHIEHIEHIRSHNICNLFSYYYIDNNIWNDYNIKDDQRCELFISFIKYIKDNGILISIPNNYNDIVSFFYNIYNKSEKYYNYFLRLFMSTYITLYTPKYFYDNLEKDILSEKYLYIFHCKQFLIIIKSFIDYKYIPINLIKENIHKYIKYLKLIKTDTEKAVIIEKSGIVFYDVCSIEHNKQIYDHYIETIEAITNELYFACSYRYVWIGAVIRGIFCKYSCFGYFNHF